MPLIEAPITPSVDPTLAQLITLVEGQYIQCVGLYGWTQFGKVGSGATATYPMYDRVATGVTANSAIGLQAECMGLGYGVSYNVLDLSKKLRIIVDISKSAVDAQCNAWFQIKAAITVADLVASGLGIKVINANLYGESYGASGREQIDLSTALVWARSYRVEIILYPGSKIEWYVNGSLAGTTSAAGYVPTGTISGPQLILAIANGAAGGVANNMVITRLWKIQDP